MYLQTLSSDTKFGPERSTLKWRYHVPSNLSICLEYTVPKLGKPKSEQYQVKTDINEASDKPQALDMPLKESDICW